MSRILKRPMFRKGGPAMEGVMTGIEDRTNFNNGDLVKRAQERRELLRQLTQLPEGEAGVKLPSSALTNFLLQFGPAIASRPTSGNIFTDIAGAARAPSANLAKQLGQEEQFERQLGLLAAKSVIDPKKDKTFAAQTVDQQVENYYTNMARTSSRGQLEALYGLRPQIKKAFEKGVSPRIADTDARGNIPSSFYANKPDGFLYINPNTGNFERIYNGKPFRRIDQDTLKPITTED
tara:strand:- start:3868 stop:4572 length:705 start_codon:yes stop_codon:yes gene_type:complete